MNDTHKGIIGTTAVILGNIPGIVAGKWASWAAFFPHDSEGWARLLSLLLASVVALLTVRSMLKKPKQ